jgi:hypothetical protein
MTWSNPSETRSFFVAIDPSEFSLSILNSVSHFGGAPARTLLQSFQI